MFNFRQQDSEGLLLPKAVVQTLRKWRVRLAANGQKRPVGGSSAGGCSLPIVVNPVTVGPLFYFCYRIGAALLRLEPGPFTFELSLDWMANVFMSVWLPLTLGCVLVGSIAALIGYVALDGLWRYSLHDYKSKKRKRRD